MDGLEAARRIRQVSPASKIVFLTAHESSPLVTRARELCAYGYLIKEYVGTELLPALEAVVLGRVYFSEHLGHE
jgi:DNA-binding NarL/FixJ family response regulator